MAPEICTKMLKKLGEKLRAKFPSTTRGSVLHGKNDAFLEVFKLQASLLEGQSLQQKKRKGEIGKAIRKF